MRKCVVKEYILILARSPMSSVTLSLTSVDEELSQGMNSFMSDCGIASFFFSSEYLELMIHQYLLHTIWEQLGYSLLDLLQR